MKKTNTGNIRRGFLFASLGSVGWGISGVCSQYLFTKYDLRADWLTAVRMLLSGLVLLLLVFRKEKIRTFTIWKNRKDVGQLLAFALFGLLMCQYTFLGAIKYSNSATATAVSYTHLFETFPFTHAIRENVSLTLSVCTAPKCSVFCLLL